MLEAEMTDALAADKGERTDARFGYRFGLPGCQHEPVLIERSAGERGTRFRRGGGD